MFPTRTTPPASRRASYNLSTKVSQYLDKALALNPDYDDAMTYKNLLLSPKGPTCEPTEEEKASSTAQADEWFNKALETRKKNQEKKQRPPDTLAVDSDVRSRELTRSNSQFARKRSSRLKSAAFFHIIKLNDSSRGHSRPVEKHHPGDNLDLIRRAYIFSAKEHKGQVRASGEPYLTHPLEVANILAEMKMDAVTVSVGLLHDVVEDTLVSLEDVEELFGPEVAHIVDGVTKISQIQFTSKEAKQAENFRKMLLAMTDDIRVIMVKFADRLHNMRTLEYLSAERREAIARETMEIYAPLANRLGMGKIRGELEDLAFSYLDPKAYQELKDLVERKRKTHEAFLAEDHANRRREDEGARHSVLHGIAHQAALFDLSRSSRSSASPSIRFTICSRFASSPTTSRTATPRSASSTTPGVRFPGRIKDFIAMPRPNMYQSLHTSVIAGGQPFEVQIRTAEMHRIAEEGIAAHWKYKDGKLVADDREDQRIVWLRHLVEWQQEMKDPADFLSTLKVDLYPEEVYTFTPKGKVDHAAARRHARRFRLCDSHRSRQHVRRRQDQRPHGAAENEAARTATSSRSSRSPATRQAATGCRSSRRRARETRSGTG